MNKEDDDSFNKKGGPIEPFARQSEGDSNYHQVNIDFDLRPTAPLTRTRSPNEGATNSFKSFLKQKQGQFQSDTKEPLAGHNNLNQNSGSKNSSGDKKSLILSMHSVDEEVLPD